MSSSRIRRRNQCGFKGIGTPSKWTKNNEYGSYLKLDYDAIVKDNINVSDMVFVDAFNTKLNKQFAAQYRALNHNTHHSGSKSVSQMMMYFRKANA